MPNMTYKFWSLSNGLDPIIERFYDIDLRISKECNSELIRSMDFWNPGVFIIKSTPGITEKYFARVRESGL